LVKSNIPVLHSLSFEEVQNFTKISGVYSKNFFFSKHQNKGILAFIYVHRQHSNKKFFLLISERCFKKEPSFKGSFFEGQHLASSKGMLF
jgi:hypothetical protein